jgi:hypothetical protein
MTKIQWEQNQSILQTARKEVISNPGLSQKLFSFRTNPSDPSFPLAYRQLDRVTLSSVVDALELV